MAKILIFGNSGSGKSTLAQHLVQTENLAHLDLDTLAGLPGEPPNRAPLAESNLVIKRFLNSNSSWVIEGCYGDLLRLVESSANEIVFMNIPVELCVNNARSRPWEPHKYQTMDAQNGKLEMLIAWIRQYPERDDVCSLQNHLDFYNGFSGTKCMETNNR